MAGAMVVVGVLCFAAFIVVFALARGPGAHDGGGHAASRSAVGFAGVAELLRATGTPAVVSRGAELAETPAAGLLVLTPPPGKKPPADVAGEVRADAVLLVLPKWATVPLADHPGWVRPLDVLPARAVLGVLPDGRDATLARRNGVASPVLSAVHGFRAAVSPGPVDGLQVLDRTRLTPLLQDAGGGTVLGRAGDLYVLSDPDLLNNGALATEGGAGAALALLNALADGGTVAFDLSLNGYGRAHDPLRAIFEAPLLGATLCAAAAAVLVGLLAAVRFGPAQRPGRSFDLGKAALAANSAALYARAGREARLAVPYAAVVRAAAARALRLPRRLSPAEADAALERIARRRAPAAEPLPALLGAAEAVRTPADLVAAARRLHAWKEELSRGSG